MIYQIANIKLRINTSYEDIWWTKFFLSREVSNPDIDIKILYQYKKIYELEQFLFENPINQCFRNCSEIMFVDREWKSLYVLPPIQRDNINVFLLEAFYVHAVYKQIIQIHSSLIEIENSALMFLGPSGIGKTTQAELWNKYRNARIINGDIVFVQETPDAFLGWGTPWHGSSPYCENTSVPVKALIVLKQAQENSIRELTGFEKVTAVSNNVFYPRWLEGGMELCLETLNHLLSALPVYELSCRPDEEAVRLTEEAVFGGSE